MGARPCAVVRVCVCMMDGWLGTVRACACGAPSQTHHINPIPPQTHTNLHTCAKGRRRRRRPRCDKLTMESPSFLMRRLLVPSSQEATSSTPASPMPFPDRSSSSRRGQAGVFLCCCGWGMGCDLIVRADRPLQSYSPPPYIHHLPTHPPTLRADDRGEEAEEAEVPFQGDGGRGVGPPLADAEGPEVFLGAGVVGVGSVGVGGCAVDAEGWGGGGRGGGFEEGVCEAREVPRLEVHEGEVCVVGVVLGG